MLKGIHDAKQAGSKGNILNLSSVHGLQAAERALKVIGARMEGNDYSKLRLRRQLFAMIGFHGTPHLWITISPADLYSPVLMYFCGCKLKLGQGGDDVPQNLPEFRERLKLMAANPVASAVFFDRIADACLRKLIGGVDEQNQRKKDRLGVLGVVRSFFGVVETQGRGTEHLHSVIWLRYGDLPARLQEEMMKDDPKDENEKNIDSNDSKDSKNSKGGKDAKMSDVDEAESKLPADKVGIAWLTANPGRQLLTGHAFSAFVVFVTNFFRLVSSA